MKIDPIRAAMNAPHRKLSAASAAAALPTSTGAIAAGSVRGRAAISQMRRGLIGAGPGDTERAPRRRRRDEQLSMRGASAGARAYTPLALGEHGAILDL